ncbi:M20/M25/M40 family metallo-hydrolase [Nocardia sp. FBN12]|uniref:M20/M25/M40 family metallo-hydrolase n=1 Tax=Nocardia sp. FBN12 TaxID=3419766 RepID=UPI003D049034
MTICDKDRLIADLQKLVAVPSISADPSREQDVHRSARIISDSFRSIGVATQVVCMEGGLPAVIGRIDGPENAPVVLLYAHHDVQPVGDESVWQSDPFVVTCRGGRLYGRGTADDKGAIAVHLEALRQLGHDLPVSVVVLIEGEEEIGSPTLEALLAEHAHAVRADYVLALDSVNADVRVPSITTSLRGLLNVLITVRTASHPVHSGVFGGAVPDSLTALVRLLSTMTDEKGQVSVKGIQPGTRTAADSPLLDGISGQAGLLAGVDLIGDGPIAQRVWNAPALSVTGIDAPDAVGAANVLLPSARAAVSIRLSPEQDPASALQAVEDHLREHAPWGVAVEIEPCAVGAGWRADQNSPAFDLVRHILTDAFGTSAVGLGVGGGIPFIASLSAAMPSAEVLVTAIQDPYSQAHAPDESVALSSLVSAATAEIEILRRLGTQA